MYPLLIAKDKNAKICKDDYKLGWLIQDKNEFIWMTWGSSSTYENAIRAAKDVLLKQGFRTVLFSEIPLTTRKAVPNSELHTVEVSIQS